MANDAGASRQLGARRQAAARRDHLCRAFDLHIDTPEGVRIGTDFNGVYRTGRLPDVVTMNRHSTITPVSGSEDLACAARLAR